MLRIGPLTLKSKLILAPMAGVSDLPFRMLNRGFGAELAFVEMINCRSISHRSKRTRMMLSSLPADRPLGVQLLGCEAKFILKALDVLRAYPFEILDFNAACPAKKVVRRGEGAGLLREPKRLQSLLKLVVRNSWLPVTIKIRTGWDKDSVNASEIARLVEDAGVQGIFIHGRTRTQEYSGAVDRDTIRQVKEAVGIAVIASGDLFSNALIKSMFDETGCDAVAIARGALGNPWIFKKTTNPPQVKEIIGVMIEHLVANIDYYGERNGVMLFRKFFAWYTKGFRKIRPLREKCSRAKTRVEMLGLIEGIS